MLIIRSIIWMSFILGLGMCGIGLRLRHGQWLRYRLGIGPPGVCPFYPRSKSRLRASEMVRVGVEAGTGTGTGGVGIRMRL